MVEMLDAGGFVGHVGLIDKDFGEILNEEIGSDNIIFTDKNDLEVTIFASDVFERFVAEYCNIRILGAFEEGKGESVREALIRIASITGALRCLSKLEGWNLRFDQMSFMFEQRRDIEIIIHQQIGHLRGRSQGTTMPSNEQVETLYMRFRDAYPGAIRYVSGHDLCEIICKGVHDVFGRAHVELKRSAIAVEEVFRAAFSVENFRATALYQHLKAWEVRNPPFVVLCP
jgi:hypothetical protein